MKKTNLSIVIPIYNEEKTLLTLSQRLLAVFKTWEHKSEIIFINDGSTDSSYAILKQLAKDHPHEIKVIHLSRNFGHQQAITAGLHFASGNAVIMMDGDLQDEPEALPEFIKEWQAGNDVVYAIRKKRKESALKRAAFFNFYRLQAALTEINMPLDSGIFSLMDRKVVDIFLTLPERNRYISGLRAFIGFRQKGIEVERGRRFDGKPRVSTLKLCKLAFDAIVSMSHVPLRLASICGIVIAGAGFTIAFIAVFMKIFTSHASPGWASNLASTFFIGGVQLLFLGIIGEYLGRIYDEVKKRPYYIVSEKIGFEENVS
ncbi:MAG: glycosyltransferase family 2 protein [Nitrospinota bacterium]